MGKFGAFLWGTVCLAFLLVGCGQDSGPKSSQQSKPKIAAQNGTKPVILIVVDSLMDKPLRKAMETGRAPAMRYLRENGRYYSGVVSSFPTMSVSIDSTLLTGTYADGHRVPGLVWYSNKEKRHVFYGNGPKEAVKISQTQVVMDAIHQLNQVQLNPETKTIHEVLAEQGKQSASINALIFRGNTEHNLRMPRWIAASTPLPQTVKVTGPRWMSYAALKQLDPENNDSARAWNKYGLNDMHTAKELAYLIGQNKLPPFTIAYFPENDMAVHKNGVNHLDGIAKADEALQVVLNAFGTWEQAVKNAVWVVMGDGGQSTVLDDREAAKIDLRRLLQSYRIAPLSRPVQAGDQIVISSNERMAYLYAIDERVRERDLVKLLQQEAKIDLIAWNSGQDVVVTAGKDDSYLTFRPGGIYRDEYGQSWTLQGNPDLVDLTLSEKRIAYGRYPDALARLYGALHSHEGRFLVVTAKPGHELVAESSPTHIGGAAHGSLHEKDSLVPLIVSGTNSRPKTLRIVDLKDWLLGLTAGKGANGNSANKKMPLLKSG